MNPSQRLVFAPVLVCLGCVYTSVAGQQGKGQDAGKGKERTFPLKTIHTIDAGPEMTNLRDGYVINPDGSKKYAEPYGADLNMLLKELKTGASNVVLVRGKVVGDAINAARLVLTVGSRSAGVAAKPSWPVEDAQLWVVVYLGSSSSRPPAWEIKSVTQKGDKVRVTNGTS